MYKIPAKTLFVGKKLIFLTSCHSTNEEAHARMNEGGLPDGSIIITGDQQKGRGQMGNSWESEPGKNLTFRIVLYTKILSLSFQFRLTQSVSLGILKTLHPFAPGFSVKWPNDIYHNDTKMGGILIQNVLAGSNIDHSIIGIGLNINQLIFSSPNATSLAKITGTLHSLNDLLGELAVDIEKYFLELKNNRHDSLHRNYINQLYRFGEDHLFKAEDVFSGRIIDVRPSGELVVETLNGERNFWFKEIEFM
ncbi:MAG: biotin--[acetyl-CoA-carboxylase] ligase [Cyclobacteriaceae bacterium]